MIPTLLVMVLIVVIGVSVLAYRNRSSKGIESGISSFRRELRALAPESDEGPRAAGPPVDPPRTSGVGVLRDDAGTSGAEQARDADQEAGTGQDEDEDGGTGERDAGAGND